MSASRSADDTVDKTPRGEQPAIFTIHPTSLSTTPIPTQYDPSSTKQKRRRTSPQDHVVLEAAYAKNSKPDKAERAEIVRCVQLGEKEVQIWFQNRRQNDRRKSKPLLPHELIPHFRNGVPHEILHQTASPDTSFSTPDADASFNTDVSGQEESPESSADNRPLARSTNINDLLNPSSSATANISSESFTSLQQQGDVITPPSSFEDQQQSATTTLEDSLLEKKVSSTEESSQSGSGRKRAHEEISSVERDDNQSKSHSVANPIPLLRSSSFVRLAMTVDGAVKIRTNNEPTPSPPKTRLPAPGAASVKNPLARSRSAIDSAELFKDVSSTAFPSATAGAFGRSRDVRTWEFFCDSNAREALSSHAEVERSGSAIGAINLIRSNSQKSRGHALSPANDKGNLRTKSHAHKSDKGKLSRAKSSLGRLQHSGETSTSDVLKPSGQGQGATNSPDDSDKENWAPGTRQSEHALRRTQPSGSTRQVLRSNEDVLYPDAPASSSARKVNAHDGKGETQISPSKEKAKGEELDCINGLLSLSQGAWR